MGNEVFDIRIKVGGDRAILIREIVERKQIVEHRKTYSDTIEAIILEYPDLLDLKVKNKLCKTKR